MLQTSVGEMFTVTAHHLLAAHGDPTIASVWRWLRVKNFSGQTTLHRCPPWRPGAASFLPDLG